jgi:hypothetical protein
MLCMSLVARVKMKGRAQRPKLCDKWGKELEECLPLVIATFLAPLRSPSHSMTVSVTSSMPCCGRLLWGVGGGKGAWFKRARVDGGCRLVTTPSWGRRWTQMGRQRSKGGGVGSFSAAFKGEESGGQCWGDKEGSRRGWWEDKESPKRAGGYRTDTDSLRVQGGRRVFGERRWCQS